MIRLQKKIGSVYWRRPPGLRWSLLVCGLAIAAGAAAAPRTEADLKAAYIYNLARYTQWHDRPAPATGVQRDPLRLCIGGSSLIAEKIRAGITQHKSDKGYEVIDYTGGVSECDLLYLDSGPLNLVDGLGVVQLDGVLTLGNGHGFVDSSGIIAFVVKGNKLRFVVNLAAARRAGLSISSHILKLALEVVDDE